MSDEKPHVHELKAYDFHLDQWHPISECPRDGSEFIVKSVDGMMHVARWQDGRVVLKGGDAYGGLSDLVEWRKMS